MTSSTVAPASYGKLVIAETATAVADIYANSLDIAGAKELKLNSKGLILNGAGPLISGLGTISGGGTSYIECYGGNGGNNGTFSFTPGFNSLDYLSIQFNGASDYVSLGTDLNINFSAVGAFYQFIGSFKLNGFSLIVDAGSDFGPPSSGLGEIYGGGNSSLFINGSVGFFSATDELYMNNSNNSLKVLSFNPIPSSAPLNVLKIGNAINITDSLSIRSGGTIITNSNVTLVSTSSLKGRLGNMNNGTLTGDLKVQTFARGGITDWVNIGVSGVTGETINSGWYGQIPMAIENSPTGVTSVANTYFESVQRWNEGC
ncbi:MAG: hypothetical protein IPJ60_15345 [Sphingobacteriaceae bacterium]|nr:hypothetical protein [Sphingobacteriaceae bacterium]